MKQLYTILLGTIFMFANQPVKAQVPTCDPNVPFYQVNLTGNPSGTWTSPGHSRQGNCCGGSDECTSFEVILDSQAVMLNFNIASGAIPPGALYYQINCEPAIAVGEAICITGTGPHYITFCKPGNNQNTYIITSIAAPIFPGDDSVRIGCSTSLPLSGLDTNSITWNSLYPGAPGDYNSYLSCTDCSNPVYTPPANAPPYIDYEICGTPTSAECGITFTCDTLRIYNVTPLSATVTPDSATLCLNGPGVLLTANASGGNGNYTYEWTDQSNNIVGTNATYQATAAGTYTLEIKDGLYSTLQCPPYLLSIPVSATLPPVVMAGPDQTICASSPTAYLSGNVQYADSAMWSGGGGTFNPGPVNLLTSYTPTPSEVSSGVVTLILTSMGAGGGCDNTSDTLQLFYPPELAIAMPNQTLLCHNSTITLAPGIIGGVQPYSYSWSTGPTTSSITVGQGNYCLTVTDFMGCTQYACVSISAPLALDLTMSSTDVSVIGGNDGTATTNPTGGTTPYTYLWSDGQTTSTATGLVYGIYTVQVTDANGCTISSSVVVNDPFCQSLEATTTTSSLPCYNDAGAIAVATVTGGTAPYSYQWDDAQSQTTDTASGLIAGTYLVVVTDSNGCMDVTNAVITQPAQLVNNMTQTNVSTIGGNDGSATANPSGGTPGYTYLWNTGDTTSSVSGLTPGVYMVEITDNNNCALLDSVMIGEPVCNNLLLGVYVNSVSCSGESNGSATSVAAFGTPPYSFLWSNGQTTSSITGLPAGNYSVTVTDSIGCTAFQTATVTQPSALSISLSPTNITCASLNNGTIELTISGGTIPYSYNWSNGINVEDQNNLSDGTYSVTVTDANGCTANGSAAITSPDPVAVTYTKNDVLCNGEANGNIDASVSGGVTPYTFSWSNGATTEDISGLTAGQYFLTVTDANGCNSSVTSVLIDEPAPLSVQSMIVTSDYNGYAVSCNGFTNGSVNLTITGGITSYSFTWSNGSTTEDLTEVGAGTYTVLVTDSNGCQTTDSISLNEPAALALSSSVQDVECNGDATGTIDLSVNGGTSPYAYNWSNGGTNESNSGLAAGTYTVQILDANQCAESGTIVINQPEALYGNLYSPILSNGHNVSFYQGGDGSIISSMFGGTAPYQYLWSNGATSPDLNNVPAGTYSVVITDLYGCTFSANVTLAEPYQLAMPTGYSPNSDGKNDYFVVRGLEAYPENKLDVYNRWGNQVFTIENYANDWDGRTPAGGTLPDGTYFVILSINGEEIRLNGFVDIRR